MQQTIKNTTTTLLTSLPQEHVHFTPSDFRNAGFPDYLIHRILLEVDRNLAESIQLPESDWVDMHAENVRESWDQFLSAIKSESRVPASFAQSVIESAVEDVIDQLTQPRSYLLDTLIGEKSATLYQIQSRKYWVVTNTILAEALIRYMQRKEVDSISREKAHQVISHVDDKLAENYTPLKWAQHLDPVFTLLQNEVPSALFVRFFKDRDMDDYAKWIDMGPEFLSRTTFIERISTVGMLPDVESEENEPESIPNVESETPPESIGDLYEDSKDEFETSFETTTDETFESEEPILEETPPFDLQEESISDDIPEVVSLDDVIAEESEPQPLFAQFLSNEDETVTEEEEIQDDLSDAPFSFDPVSEDDQDDIDTVSEPEIEAEPEPESPLYELTDDDSESDDVEPKTMSIAESFSLAAEEPTISDKLINTVDEEVNAEEVAQKIGGETSADYEELDEPEDTPPIIDASSDDEHVIYLTDRAKKLLDLLEPNFETYVVEIFLNDELDFYKHLENIVTYDQWRSAGRYITRDIFDRNRIDLYSEPAVMFTDAVQEFFDQNA